MEQLVARRAHNPKVVGSSPAPATKTENQSFGWFFYFKVIDFQSRGGVPIKSGVARRAHKPKICGRTLLQSKFPLKIDPPRINY